MAVVYLCSPANQEFVTLLGFRYPFFLDFLRNKHNKPELLGLGNALSEESRIKILEFISEHKEVTCKELEQSFKISGSTIYHHLTLMLRTGILKIRNEGKNLSYSIDTKYFDNIILTLSKFSNKWKGNKYEKSEHVHLNQIKQNKFC